MMKGLLNLTANSGIIILNAVEVKSVSEQKDSVLINTNQFEFRTNKSFVTTNGFASLLLNEEVKPARAQVLITKPIPNLDIKETFHLDDGYYYFRYIDNRILLGGGRNLDFKTEETSKFEITEVVHKELEKLLKQVILPKINFEIDQS